MRWSRQFIPTMKETPQEAEIPSHRLMLRAGLIRRLGSGLYTFLPLGWKALRKVENIIREEMDRAGALEVLMPAMQPREIWEQTGRYEIMQETMFSITDRQDRSMVLGPTHEEVITDLVSREIRSYRDLPKNFYQIQTKFRDEIRPRFGLMRAKEFIMKDAYSFDVDWEGVQASYDAMYRAYVRIFTRCGLRAKAVEADSGPMGGNSSHEFMVLADSGEDGVVECSKCAYAANLEKAESHVFKPAAPETPSEPLSEVHTPDARTIEEVSKFLKIKPRQMVKTLIYSLDGQPTAILVPGDRDVNELKIGHALGATDIALAEDSVVEKVTGAPVGFAGPQGLAIPVYADVRLEGRSGAVSGANKADYHVENLDLARDADIRAFHDFSFVRKGDACPKCREKLVEKRGIEVGHVFQLGTKYSDQLGAHFLDAEGQQKPSIMGCYGIGVTRTLQSAIEQSHDKDGIIWPISIAPYEVEVLALNMQHDQSVQAAEGIVEALESSGVEVLYDDRDERPGFKFKDADLVGIPIRVAVGERSLENGEVEIKIRSEGEVVKIPQEEAAAYILNKVEALKQALIPAEGEEEN